jgi:hypothetical protein
MRFGTQIYAAALALTAVPATAATFDITVPITSHGGVISQQLVNISPFTVQAGDTVNVTWAAADGSLIELTTPEVVVTALRGASGVSDMWYHYTYAFHEATGSVFPLTGSGDRRLTFQLLATTNLGRPTDDGTFSFRSLTQTFTITDGTAHTLNLARFETSFAAEFRPVPEPASWALMIAGFGVAGGALRRRRITGRVAHA